MREGEEEFKGSVRDGGSVGIEGGGGDVRERKRKGRGK